MNYQKKSFTKWILYGILLFSIAFPTLAQKVLYIYKDGQIIYASPVEEIDSAAFYPPSHWEEKRSEVTFMKIQSYPELSIFANILKQTGYNTKLDNKTIWAPHNDAFKDFDLNDKIKIQALVENHISDGLYIQSPISMVIGKVTMINQKRMDLTKTDNDYFLDGNKILVKGIKTPTGQINIIDDYIPYRPTLWEYLIQMGTADSMRTFLLSYNKRTYDAVAKDSVITNELLTNIAASLKLETMEYTVLIPDDQLWNETINHLMQFYPPSTDPLQIAFRLDNVKKIILKDLFIKGRKSTLLNDTLFLTSLGNELVNPAEIFGNGLLIIKLSNGNILKISKLNHLNTTAKEVRVEAENPINRSYSNCTVVSKTKISTLGFPISNNAYADVFPLTTSSLQKVWVQYSIQNLLPGKYNIYVVFVPSYIEDTTKALPYLVNFYLTFPNLNGATQSNVVSTNVVTNPKTISKILVQSDFVVNFFDMGLAGATNPLIKVRVENAAKSNQTTLYNREILTDCILFEPVQ